ncbi:hypothetical protein BDZ91DRAFT_768513 [Kalaharituber pfeilii]|nr:hypothetical protein BDZ91DRAFT_768513 [Kalaharituber pfeilii]
MSLNGLDAPELYQTFEGACSEPGSWFLLKYTSRDDIGLLAKGASGTLEMREKIAEEPDDSPLYGFIRYRRRNILLKYVPDGTSRVLKARSQVHFQLIGEQFTPHDVIFSFSTAKELTDAALTSACSTHSATASISSSNSSLQNRRLADIAESVEESHAVEQSDSQNAVGSLEKESGPTVVVTTHDPVIGSTPFSSSDPRQGELLTSIQDSRTNEPTHSAFGISQELRRGSSSSDSHPPITDLYGSLYTPKVKLAPRLSADTLKRPHSANSNSSAYGGSQEDLRPVASVPKSVQVPHRKAKDRRNSVTSDTASGPAVAPPSVEPPAPSLSEVHLSPAPEVLASLGPPQPSGPSALSPEKQRLMRALQLRKSTMKHEGENTPESTADAQVGEEGTLPTDDKANLQVKVEKLNVDEKIDELDTSEKTAEEDVDNAKVRGSDHEENDSDVSSIISVEIAVAQPRPVSTFVPRGSVNTLTTPPNPASQRASKSEKLEKVEAPGKTEKQEKQEKTVRSEKQEEETKTPATPIVLTKQNPKEPSSTSDEPIVETARSVSAPVLSNARRDRTSIGTPRTVNVSSGSVFQRIKQLEMLNRNAPPASAPLRSPSVRTITPPSITMVKKTTVPGKPPTPISLERAPSHAADAPIIHQQPIQVMPPIPPKSDYRTAGRSTMPLEVTTKITRRNDKAIQTDPALTQLYAVDTSSQAINSPPGTGVYTPEALVVPASKFQEQDPSAELPRRSIDVTSTQGQKGNDNANSMKDKSTFREKASAMLHKLNIDIDNLPPLPMSPIASPGSTSPVEPSPPAGRPKSLFSRDKEKNLDKKLSKKDSKEKEKQKEREEKEKEKEKEKEDKGSPKAEKKSLLRRMSSITRIVREAPQPVVQAPAEPPPKTNLLAGWVNVQLPDTMLWRRKCIKVDSTGWLFLGVTDDDTAPGTRKYHIPTDVRSVKIPDPDEQELPFSVQLDLHEGGTLQCACQNSLEQKEVLTVIQNCFA